MSCPFLSAFRTWWINGHDPACRFSLSLQFRSCRCVMHNSNHPCSKWLLSSEYSRIAWADYLGRITVIYAWFVSKYMGPIDRSVCCLGWQCVVVRRSTLARSCLLCSGVHSMRCSDSSHWWIICCRSRSTGSFRLFDWLYCQRDASWALVSQCARYAGGHLTAINRPDAFRMESFNGSGSGDDHLAVCEHGRPWCFSVHQYSASGHCGYRWRGWYSGLDRLGIVLASMVGRANWASSPFAYESYDIGYPKYTKRNRYSLRGVFGGHFG